MNTTKLTTCEKRALSFCETLNRFDGGTVNIEWKRSKVWGYNPVIAHHGGKCCNVSGCGYDKKSTALAEVLKFLFPIGSEAYNDIAPLGGSGESTVRHELAKHGWELKCASSGSTWDAYDLTRIVEKGKEDAAQTTFTP